MRNEERRKLTASWLNILAASVISTGSIVQLVLDVSLERSGQPAGRTLFTAGICLAVGVTLHAFARLMVGDGRAE
jgi:hypothetical protein